MIRVPIIAGLECQGHSHPPNPVPGGLLGKKKTERKQKKAFFLRLRMVEISESRLV